MSGEISWPIFFAVQMLFWMGFICGRTSTWETGEAE